MAATSSIIATSYRTARRRLSVSDLLAEYAEEGLRRDGADD